MSITRKDVEYAAQLSRITLPEEQLEKFTGQLARIVDYINQLNELDTSDVEPMSHPLDVQNVLRPDEVRPSLTPDEAIANGHRGNTPRAAHYVTLFNLGVFAHNNGAHVIRLKVKGDTHDTTGEFQQFAGHNIG